MILKKKTQRTRSRGNFIKNPIANSILYGERLKAFLLRLETKYGYLLSSLLVNIVLGVLASAIGKKNNKRQQVLKENKTVFICRQCDHLCRKSYKRSTKQLLELISE